jgi:putative lipoic acid-binding regulatory protein
MNNNIKPTLEQLLEFPCPFAIKIMGVSSGQLIGEVSAIIGQHCPEFNADRDLSYKSSSKGNYLSITATITAQSKAHLDGIYQQLNQHSLVKFTL